MGPLCCYCGLYCCSGRIRHTTRPGSYPGIALINVTLDEGQWEWEILEQPFPSLESWQWVGHNYPITGGGNMSVVLTVRQGEGEDHIQGTAYFDDLCVSFTQGGFSSSPGVRHLTTSAVSLGRVPGSNTLVLCLL